MIDLIAIRARDEDDYATAEVLRNIQWAGNTDPELTATINMVADRHALHVKKPDEAYHIGKDPLALYS